MSINLLKRNSSVELLKIIAIFGIIISHVVQTLAEISPFSNYSDYVLNIYQTTSNPLLFLLCLFWKSEKYYKLLTISNILSLRKVFAVKNI